MAWIVLVVAGLLEAVWATALSASAGLTQPVPSAVFAVATVLSVVGLGWSMRHIPTATAYAIWTGIGAVVTVVYAAATGAEHLTALRGLFLVGIIGCVVGLKKTSDDEQQAVAEELVEEPMDVH
ncbi:DMT family transporter [Propioniciclava flava]